MHFFIAALLFFLPSPVGAGELTADKIQQDVYGMISATGHVQLQTKDFKIKASTIDFDVDSQAARLQDATVYFDGFTLKGKQLRRIDLENFSGTSVTFSTCPEDEWAWSIVADEAVLDNENGVFTAKHAWFEWGGVPVLYTPYWSSALTRRSGFLMPEVGESNIRGTEIAAPFYWAAAPNWDMTFTPRWMSLRGMMSDIEWQHRSATSYEMIQIQGIFDEQTQTRRGRLRSDVSWQPNQAMQVAVNIDAIAVGDGLYIADYPLQDENASTAYLTSSTAFRWTEGRDSLVVSGRYQQQLGSLSNDTTLQILPRVETRHYFDVGLPSLLTLEHQTTRFDRIQGFSGLRSGVNPSLTLPWHMQEGAVSAFWSIQGQAVGYDTEAFASQNASYLALASSIQIEAAFERVFADRQWRHEIKPILRLDLSSTPNQSDIPRYDSVLLPLSVSNILQGNRYSGWDRFERMRRVSMLLTSSLEKKDEQADVRRVLEGQLGLVWDGLRESVDVVPDAAPSGVTSNLLAEISWLPSLNTRLSVGGQHNPDLNAWVESHATLSWMGLQQQHLNIAWQRTDASHSTALESLNVSGRMQLNQRWQAYASARYDLLRDYTLNANFGVVYQHACWEFGIERYQSYQVGSNGVSDEGTRILLVFDGLGSLAGR